MVRETIKVAAPQSAGVEVEKLGIGTCFPDADPELGEKIITQLFRSGIKLFEDFVEVRLNTAVKPSIHGG